MRIALPVQDLDLAIAQTPSFWLRFAGARLFITGGSGFIGNWLIQTIQRANDTLGSRIDIVALSRDAQRARQVNPLVFKRSDIRLLQGDVTHFERPPGSFDLCVHAATDVGDPAKLADPLRTFDSIVNGTRRVLELAQAQGARRFLLTSSGAVYGTQPPALERVPESYTGAPDPLQVQAAYGNGKRSAEWLACAQASQGGSSDCEVAIARIFALLGPGLPLDGPFAAGNFVRDVLREAPIHIQGDGRPLRSYLYMADLCIWLLRILESGAPGQAYNVGSEQAISIQTLAEQVVQVAGSSVPIHMAHPASTPSAPPRYVPDTAKARQSLALREWTPLPLAIEKTLQWSRLAMTS
jgi:dTDP-glucose 4,6-dehydratase